MDPDHPEDPAWEPDPEPVPVPDSAVSERACQAPLGLGGELILGLVLATAVLAGSDLVGTVDLTEVSATAAAFALLAGLGRGAIGFVAGRDSLIDRMRRAEPLPDGVTVEGCFGSRRELARHLVGYLGLVVGLTVGGGLVFDLMFEDGDDAVLLLTGVVAGNALERVGLSTMVRLHEREHAVSIVRGIVENEGDDNEEDDEPPRLYLRR